MQVTWDYGSLGGAIDGNSGYLVLRDTREGRQSDEAHASVTTT